MPMKSPFQQFEQDQMIADPGNYKWGIFYYHTRDTRIIVPKRARYMGWTFNFAHPATYLILFTLVGAALIAEYLTR